MIEALRSGHIRHAGLDVFVVEPMPAGHVLTTLENVTLSAHSAFRTPEASDNLIGGTSPDFSYRLKGLKGKRRVCTLKWWRYDSATVESPGGRSGGVGIGAVEYDRWRCLFRQRAAAFVSAARARAKSR
jgi:hypothetical protein